MNKTMIASIIACGSIFAGGFASGALAAYPDRPIEIIVPTPPGGGTDTAIRRLADEAEKQMDALQETLVSIREHGTETGWMEQFKRHQGITALDRAVVVALIDKILIQDGNAIEIIYRWQDEFAWQLDVLRRAQLREAV